MSNKAKGHFLVGKNLSVLMNRYCFVMALLPLRCVILGMPPPLTHVLGVNTVLN